MPVGPRKAKNVPRVTPDAVSLAEIVPDARAVQWAGAEPGEINEIPLDPASPSPVESPLDLRLGARSRSKKRVQDDVAAAQAVSLPARSPKRETSSSLRSELANLPLFQALAPASLHELISRVRVVRLAQGQVLFRQGDAANALYLVVEGAVVPIAEGAEGEGRRKLAVIERGDFVGSPGTELEFAL